MPLTPSEAWTQRVKSEVQTKLSDPEQLRKLGLQHIISPEAIQNGEEYFIIERIALKYFYRETRSRLGINPETAAEDALRCFATEISTHSPSPFHFDDDTCSDDDLETAPGTTEELMGLIGRAHQRGVLKGDDATRCIYILQQQSYDLEARNLLLKHRESSTVTKSTALEMSFEQANTLASENKRITAEIRHRERELSRLKQALSARESIVKQEASRLEDLGQTLQSRETTLKRQQDEHIASELKWEETRSAQEEALSKREDTIRTQEEKSALDVLRFEQASSRKDNELKLRETNLAQREAELQSRSVERALVSKMMMGLKEDLNNLRERETKAHHREENIKKREEDFCQTEEQLRKQVMELGKMEGEFRKREHDLQQRMQRQDQAEENLQKAVLHIEKLQGKVDEGMKEIAEARGVLTVREELLQCFQAELAQREEKVQHLEKEAAFVGESLDLRETRVQEKESSLVRQDKALADRYGEYQIQIFALAEESRKRAETEQPLKERGCQLEAIATKIEQEKIVVMEERKKEEELQGRISEVQKYMQAQRLSLEGAEEKIRARDQELNSLQSDYNYRLSSLQSDEVRLRQWFTNLQWKQNELDTREVTVTAQEGVLSRLMSPSPGSSSCHNPFLSSSRLSGSASLSPHNPFHALVHTPAFLSPTTLLEEEPMETKVKEVVDFERNMSTAEQAQSVPNAPQESLATTSATECSETDSSSSDEQELALDLNANAARWSVVNVSYRGANVVNVNKRLSDTRILARYC